MCQCKISADIRTCPKCMSVCRPPRMSRDVKTTVRIYWVYIPRSESIYVAILVSDDPVTRDGAHHTAMLMSEWWNRSHNSTENFFHRYTCMSERMVHMPNEMLVDQTICPIMLAKVSRLCVITHLGREKSNQFLVDFVGGRPVHLSLRIVGWLAMERWRYTFGLQTASSFSWHSYILLMLPAQNWHRMQRMQKQIHLRSKLAALDHVQPMGFTTGKPPAMRAWYAAWSCGDNRQQSTTIYYTMN